MQEDMEEGPRTRPAEINLVPFLAAAVVIVEVCALAVAALKREALRGRSLRERMAGCMCAASSWCLCQGGGDGASVIEQLAREEVRKECARRMEICMKFSRFAVSSICAVNVARSVALTSDTESGATVPASQMFVGLIGWLAAFFGTGVCDFVNPRNADAWYVVFAIFRLVTLVGEHPDQWFSHRQLGLLVLAQYFCCCRLWLVGLDCLLATMCRVLVEYANAVPSGTASGPTLVGKLLAAELLTLITTSICVASLRKHDFERFKQRFEERALRLNNGAMTRMLDLMCDVVVELDAQFRVAQPAPHLCALLMLDASRTVQGQHFQDFMPSEEDKCRFETFARASMLEPSGAMPGAMLATLQGPSVLIPAEITFVPFRDVQGVSRLLVGMREVVNQPVAELRTTQVGNPPVAELHSAQAQGAGGQIAPADGSGQAVGCVRRGGAAEPDGECPLPSTSSDSGGRTPRRRERTAGRGTPTSSPGSDRSGRLSDLLDLQDASARAARATASGKTAKTVREAGEQDLMEAVAEAIAAHHSRLGDDPGPRPAQGGADARDGESSLPMENTAGRERAAGRSTPTSSPDSERSRSPPDFLDSQDALAASPDVAASPAARAGQITLTARGSGEQGPRPARYGAQPEPRDLGAPRTPPLSWAAAEAGGCLSECGARGVRTSPRAAVSGRITKVLQL